MLTRLFLAPLRGPTVLKENRTGARTIYKKEKETADQTKQNILKKT